MGKAIRKSTKRNMQNGRFFMAAIARKDAEGLMLFRVRAGKEDYRNAIFLVST